MNILVEVMNGFNVLLSSRHDEIYTNENMIQGTK